MPARRSSAGPLMLRGSLFSFRRRCGKANCRCASGDPHESPALSYVEEGVSKTLTLTGVDLEEVRAAIGRYEQARTDLDAKADAGIAALRARLGQRKKVRR